jgi:hypothetical protein
MARSKTPILEMDQERDRVAEPQASQPLPLLDGFEIVDDCAHLVGLEDEFRHVWVTGRNALGQRLGKPFDFELAGERTERGRLRVRTGAAAADSMAAGTIGGQQRLAAACSRAGLFRKNRPRQADGEEANEKPVGD